MIARRHRIANFRSYILSGVLKTNFETICLMKLLNPYNRVLSCLTPPVAHNVAGTKRDSAPCCHEDHTCVLQRHVVECIHGLMKRIVIDIKNGFLTLVSTFDPMSYYRVHSNRRPHKSLAG